MLQRWHNKRVHATLFSHPYFASWELWYFAILLEWENAWQDRVTATVAAYYEKKLTSEKAIPLTLAR